MLQPRCKGLKVAKLGFLNPLLHYNIETDDLVHGLSIGTLWLQAANKLRCRTNTDQYSGSRRGFRILPRFCIDDDEQVTWITTPSTLQRLCEQFTGAKSSTGYTWIGLRILGSKERAFCSCIFVYRQHVALHPPRLAQTQPPGGLDAVGRSGNSVLQYLQNKPWTQAMTFMSRRRRTHISTLA